MASPRRTRQQWRKLVAELDRSGLSPKAFAATRKQLNPGTLSWWRTRLRREEAPRPDSGSSSAFLPVVVEAVKADVETRERWPVEVVLANGVTLRFEHALDGRGLERLARAFQGGS